MFLKIENAGVAPFEGFTIFGATSKRGSNNPLIVGTFGSGGKMAVGTLLRKNINPQVFCGLTKLSFFTKPMKMKSTSGDVDHKQVCVQFKGSIDGKPVNRQEDLSFVLDYGTADWNDVSLAMREFVSNAIDGQIDATGDFAGVVIEVVDESRVRAKEGCTRVFVPLTEGVQQFYNEIGKWFLHLSDPDVVRSGKQILRKKNRNRGDVQRAVIYRRGVYVREFMSSDTASLFDYNLDIDLNEARTFNDWEAKHAVGTAIRDADRNILAEIFTSILKGENKWELSMDRYNLVPTYDHSSEEVVAKRKMEWEAASTMVLGEHGVFCDNMPMIGEMIAKKGYKPVPVPSRSWVEALSHYGVRTDTTILTQDDKQGREFFPTTVSVDQSVGLVWAAMIDLGMTGGKEKPQAGTFSEPIQCEGRAMGLYRAETNMVYANTDYSENLDEQLVYIMVEEVLHYISGATDFSRDFQTLQTQVIGRMMYRAFKK